MLKRIFTLLVVALVTAGAVAQENIGVYTRLADLESADFDAVCQRLESVIDASDFDKIAVWELDTPDPHDYRAKVFVLTDSAYTAEVAKTESRRFLAVSLRFAVYEGAGRKSVLINMANPVAAAHVFFHKSDALEQLLSMAEDVKSRMAALVSAEFEGVSPEDAEPLRPADALAGYNGDGPAKVMAMFKDFEGSLKDVLKTKITSNAADQLAEACTEFEKNVAKTEEGWTLLGRVKSENACLYLISRGETEELAMRIVGLSRDSDENPAPGIDHAAAFPIEVLIYPDDNKIITATLGEMWRMQFYFWDAGYGAFAKHAQVPSQIFSSIKNVIKGK